MTTMSPTTTAFRSALLTSLLAGAGLGLSACATDGANASRTAQRPGQKTPAGTLNAFGDPLALSTTGGRENSPASTTSGAFAKTTPVGESNDPGSMALYSDIFAGPGRTSFGSSPSANLAQVSFSLEGADFDPNVSRDGSTIVFASTQHRQTPDIYIKSINSRVVTQLTSDPGADVMPRISPDGTRVAFASNRSGNWDVYVMPIAGGRAVQITSASTEDLHPSWSADGTSLVFCRLGEVSSQWEMWVTEVSNPGVAKFIGYGLFPEFCPVRGSGQNGAERIAFQKSRERGDRAFGIWTIDFKDGQSLNTTEIVSSPVAACINPTWSPDGAWLAFATVPNPSNWAADQGRPSSSHLWMVDLTGNNRISLTADSTVDLLPTWGPENKLFFVSDRGGVDNIWSLDTTPVVKLAATNAAFDNGNSGMAGGNAPHAPAHQPSVVTVPEVSGHEQH